MRELKDFELASRELVQSFLYIDNKAHVTEPHYVVKFYYSSQSKCGIRIVVEKHSIFKEMEIVLSTYEDICESDITNELALSWLKDALKMKNWD